MEKTIFFQHELFTASCDAIDGAQLQITCVPEEKDHYCICVEADFEKDMPVGDWQLQVSPTFAPDFTYTPHLTPEDDNVIDMHVFRSPVLMMGQGDRIVCAMPITDGVKNGPNRYYMDLDVPKKVMTLGITTTELCEHVLYRRTNGAVLPKGHFRFEARIMILKEEETKNPFRRPLAYFWKRYGEKQLDRLIPVSDLMACVKHTYEWAYDKWDAVFLEFDWNGKRVGAPQFIVTAHQSPNFHEPWSIREHLSVWNQAWFSSLRSAQGAYRYGKETGNARYVEKALMTKELALSFPQDDGLFDAVVGVENETVIMDGKEYIRSKDWSEHYVGNAHHNPITPVNKNAPRHILDMSWTALKMLEWYEELEKDERLLAYVKRYAEKLLTLQDADGYFPAWLEKETEQIYPQLRQSPESAASVTLLLKLYELTGDVRYRDSALRCMDVLIREVVPEGRWEDFETYWSCCHYGSDTMVGKKFPRNNCYKQGSLSRFYTAQALYACYALTGEETYLRNGERCLDEILILQNSYQPSYFECPVVGGFGVMNCDGELNAAHQSLFAELILQYGKLLDREEYIQRGMAALRASFSMMYCPENPVVKEMWEERWPFFDETDYGFTMETYGHLGIIPDYEYGSECKGMGEFTIYDWGNGAASEAVMRIRAHHGDLYAAYADETVL